MEPLEERDTWQEAQDLLARMEAEASGEKPGDAGSPESETPVDLKPGDRKSPGRPGRKKKDSKPLPDGRKKSSGDKAGEKDIRNVHFYIEFEYYKKLKIESFERGCTLSDLVVSIVKDFFD